MVAGVRLGPGADGMCLKFLWFFDSKPVGAEARIALNSGDVYFMSDKAVGYDWLTKKALTLRHAAGADKYSSVDTLRPIKDGVAPRPPIVYLLGSTTNVVDEDHGEDEAHPVPVSAMQVSTDPLHLDTSKPVFCLT
eukprot:4267478-Prymnesium_polylepis.1